MTYEQEEFVHAEVEKSKKFMLKPCPFCGAEPVVECFISYFTKEGLEQFGITSWEIRCGTENCIRYGISTDEDEDFADIAMRWNRRVSGAEESALSGDNPLQK